jgi:hypothetical protein
MKIWINPADDQVMATYSGDTTSTVWRDKGYIEKIVPPEMEREFRRYGRDCKIIATGDVITGVMPAPNVVQREPPARTQLDDLNDKLADDTITTSEMRQLMRMERGMER